MVGRDAPLRPSPGRTQRRRHAPLPRHLPGARPQRLGRARRDLRGGALGLGRPLLTDAGRSPRDPSRRWAPAPLGPARRPAAPPRRPRARQRPRRRPPQHRRPLRPRQRPVRALPRLRDDDVLGRRLVGSGAHPRAGAAGAARAHLRPPRAGRRRSPARDRHRLGRARSPRRPQPRLPGDDDDDLARAARGCRGAGPGRRPRVPGRGSRRRLPRAARPLRQARLGRDDRGGRLAVLRHLLRHLLGAARPARALLPAGDRDRGPLVRGRAHQLDLRQPADLPRRLPPLAGGDPGLRSPLDRPADRLGRGHLRRLRPHPAASGAGASTPRATSSRRSATTSASAGSGRCGWRSRRPASPSGGSSTFRSCSRSPSHKKTAARPGDGRPRCSGCEAPCEFPQDGEGLSSRRAPHGRSARRTCPWRSCRARCRRSRGTQPDRRHARPCTPWTPT